MTRNDRREIYAIFASTCASFPTATRVVRCPGRKHDDNGRENNVQKSIYT